MEQQGYGDVLHRSQSLIILGTRISAKLGRLLYLQSQKSSALVSIYLFRGSSIQLGWQRMRNCSSFASRCCQCSFWEEALPALCWQDNNCERHSGASHVS